MKVKRGDFVLISAVNVANNFIRKSKNDEIPITPLKLQKLVYFLYKEFLKRTGEVLFSEQYETWKYGPVIPSIYTEFSSYKQSPIQTYAQDSQGFSYVVEESGVFKDCLEKVWEKYKNYSGEELSQLTHSHGTAWSIARDKENPYLEREDIRNEPELP